MERREIKIALLTLAVFGAYRAACATVNCAKGILQYCVLPRKNLVSRYGEDSWALVTGASDGLGKQYATELALDGFNVILMGRNREKTEAVAREVAEKSGRLTKVLIFDFGGLESEESVKMLEALLESTYDLDVSILVNNVGVLFSGKLLDQDISSIAPMVNINVNALTYMSQFMLPRLLNRKKRSALINLTSKLGYMMMGDFGPYGAAKSYVTSLTMAMQNQYSASLDVLLVCPGSVKSGINPGTMPNSVLTDVHCKAVIDHLGWWSATRGSWRHASSWWLQNESALSQLVGPIARYRFVQQCKAVVAQEKK